MAQLKWRNFNAGSIPAIFAQMKINQAFCFFDRHKWRRLSTQTNGIGFLDECEYCGRGRYLIWAGHASMVGKLTAGQLKEYKDEVAKL